MRKFLAFPITAAALLLANAQTVLSEDDGSGFHDGEDEELEKQGPQALWWPSDRKWSAAEDNVAPCGTTAGPSNRTDFPLTGGAVALIQQDESFDVQISISYNDDPQSNDDFIPLVTKTLKDLDPGHECLPIPAPDDADTEAGAAVGSNATIQLKYVSTYEQDPANQTFYACADITFVRNADFTYNIPCFNATVPEGEDPGDAFGSGDGDDDGNDDENEKEKTKNGGLSKGAIAGIVIGCVVGVVGVALILFFLYRRDQREKRVADHTMSARNVEWKAQDNTAAKGGSSAAGSENNSVQLRDLESRGQQ